MIVFKTADYIVNHATSSKVVNTAQCNFRPIQYLSQMLWTQQRLITLLLVNVRNALKIRFAKPVLIQIQGNVPLVMMALTHHRLAPALTAITPRMCHVFLTVVPPRVLV